MSKETISIQATMGVSEAIDLCIDKVGVMKVLKIIRALCSANTMQKCTFPSSLLATEKDEEMANAACALHYLEANWKRIANKGLEMLNKKRKEASKNKSKNSKSKSLS